MSIHLAASTLLLRPAAGAAPPEVLMLRRNRTVEFAGGAMVFPGGRVDAQDHDPAWADQSRGWAEIPPAERAPRIAALREAFEEAGVLIGHDAPLPAAAAAMRPEVASARLPFREALHLLGLRPDLRALHHFSRWLTPDILPKRFDTFFYLAACPPGQEASSDGDETVAAEWISANSALELAAAGQRQIVFPTRMNLRRLAESPDLASALAACASRAPQCVTPIVEIEGETRFLRLPPEAGFGAVREKIDRF